ncbi:MAG: glycosyltransferase [Pseudomonadota bacterium]|jgi:glycosyltransferase involved in cell wall biosynthesis|nr:glycosyltransferase [Pseudomonadota bacterium]
MKIAVLAHIRHAIAEPFKGGMEAHCHALCRGLRARGHEVTLFAAAGSDDPALVPTVAQPYESVLPFELWHGTERLAAYQFEGFASAFDRVRAGSFDLVHNNSLFAPVIGWCADAGIPCVTSQHVPPFGAMRDAVAANLGRPGVEVTVTSHHQVSLWPEVCRDRLRVVPNGVDTDLWRPQAAKPEDPVGDHLSWVGRIAPNKGTAEAVRAASLARAALRVFGPIEDAAYFAREVAPHLGEQIVYQGHLDSARLQQEIRTSRAALVTPRWDEPFGLVAAEALASGTPVVGFARGAIPEVVGDYGVLVPDGDVTALARAIQAVAKVDRSLCRERALARFSIPRMIAGYENCYAAAIAACGTAGSPRAIRSSISAKALEALA